MRPLLGLKKCRADYRSICGTPKATRVANLGLMTDYLRLEAVPSMLNRSFEMQRLDAEVKLRLLPTTHPYLPTIQGINKYKHSMNAIALIIRNFVLNERCALHVIGVETVAEGRSSERYNTLTSMDKVIIRWQTCAEGCAHLGPENVTSQANFGLYKAKNGQSLSDGETQAKSQMLRYILNPGHTMSETLVEEHARPVSDEESQWQLSRVIQGIFIFELNHDNSQISVHTIDNVEMSDREKKVETGALAC